MMSYSNASVYELDQPERKSGVMKIQRRVSPPLSPLERTGNIYKNSAENSIIKIPPGKKTLRRADGSILWNLPAVSGKISNS
jgi:hypothetical protein